MGKNKSAEILSLDPKEQKQVSKQINSVKKKIEQGEITIKEKRKAQKITAEQKRGLIFISHLPHGFYEHQLKNYFKQFGKVTNVKVCRSNKTGKSKGYAYVEFSHPEVAKIAGETMNNYLMFKKRLSTEYIPYEKRPKNLFHGKSSTGIKYSAKTRRNKQFQQNATADDETYSARVKNRISRLNKKMKKLRELGLASASAITLETSNSDDNSDPELVFKQKKRSRRSSVKNNSVSTASNTDLPLATSVNIVDPKDTKKIQKQKGIVKNKQKSSKRSSNPNIASLNADTVRKIARELIRKKGPSLISFPTSDKNTKKK